MSSTYQQMSNETSDGLRRSNCHRGTKFESLPENPKVSVIITLYTVDQLSYLEDCIGGLQEQTYENVEFCILPENEEVISRVKDRYDTSNDSRIVIHSLDSVSGLSEARTIGAEKATGDIVAFLDVDAIPTPRWVEHLVNAYTRYELFAVGGRAIPIWEGRQARPAWIPPEFDWLIGSNHEEFADEGEFVRNTYGCNISFRRDVFLDLGGFDSDLGKSHGFNLQGEEPSLGVQLQTEYNTAMYYQPNALIEHAVDETQQQLRWLLERAFLQGVSKEVIDSKYADDDTPLEEEDDYLKFVLLTAFPRHIGLAIQYLAPHQIVTAVMVLVYTFFVGSGFLYSKIDPRT